MCLTGTVRSLALRACSLLSTFDFLSPTHDIGSMAVATQNLNTKLERNPGDYCDGNIQKSCTAGGWPSSSLGSVFLLQAGVECEGSSSCTKRGGHAAGFCCVRNVDTYHAVRNVLDQSEWELNMLVSTQPGPYRSCR